MVKYLSIAGSVISLLLFALGYFGCKLQSLEAVTVVQLSGLLLVSIENIGPTFNGLKYLSLSLGITSLTQDEYYYEES